MKKTTRKLLAVLLVFTMLFGSSMTVFAQEYNWSDLQEGTILQNGDTISVTGYVHSNIPNTDLVDTAVSISIGNHENMNAFGNNNYGNIDENTVLSCQVSNVQNDKVLKVTGKAMEEPTADNYEFKVSVEERNSETVPQTPSTNPTNPTNNKPIEEPTKIEEQPAHEHSYSWVTVQEASTGQDGIEEYRCSCGAVAERNVIPAGMAMVKDLVVQIETAPENSTVEIKTEYFTCYTAYIMNALRKRPDVSLKTTFKDYDKDGSIKTFTIPAGKAPDDNELFYGFTYLGNLYGWEE